MNLEIIDCCKLVDDLDQNKMKQNMAPSDIVVN